LYKTEAGTTEIKKLIKACYKQANLPNKSGLGTENVKVKRFKPGGVIHECKNCRDLSTLCPWGSHL